MQETTWDLCFRKWAREIVSRVASQILGIKYEQRISPSIIMPRELVPDDVALGTKDGRRIVLITEFFSYGTPLERRHFYKIMSEVAATYYRNWRKVELDAIFSLVISARSINFPGEFPPRKLTDGIYEAQIVPGAPPTVFVIIEELKDFLFLYPFHPRRAPEALRAALTRPHEPESKLALSLIRELIHYYSGELVRRLVEEMRRTEPERPLPPEALELAEVILERAARQMPRESVETMARALGRQKELPREALELAEVILERAARQMPRESVKVIARALDRQRELPPEALKLAGIILKKVGETNRREVVEFLRRMLRELGKAEER